MSAAVLPETGPPLATEGDAVEVIGALYGTGANWVVIPVARLAPEFFDLANRQAGHFLQKLVTYRLSVAILGDITPWTRRSTALRDFVRETDRGGQIRFVATRDALAASIGR